MGNRVLHTLKQQIVQPRLINNAVDKLGKAQSGVINLVRALNVFGMLYIRFPERVFVELVDFFGQNLAAVKSLHDLLRATGDAISLTKQHRTRL